MLKLAKPSLHPKLGLVWRTYRPVGLTCPRECPLLNNGCYAQNGPTAWHAQRSQTQETQLTQAFLALPYRSAVRHLVSGDLFRENQPDTALIEDIRRAHRKRPDVQGWGYTHGWRRLSAQELNQPNLTFNASCERPEQVEQALDRGWPAVMVVPHDHPKRQDYGAFVSVVCPNQTQPSITCDRCRLCWKADRKLQGKPLVVAFRAHGARKRAVEQRLQET